MIPKKTRVWVTNESNPNGAMINPNEDNDFAINLMGDLIEVERLYNDDDGLTYKMRFARLTHDTIEMMTSTDLLDYDNNEIFEGDFLEFRDWKVEVRFMVGCYMGIYTKMATLEEVGQPLHEVIAKNQWRIIGNVFETPELIGTNKY